MSDKVKLPRWEWHEHFDPAHGVLPLGEFVNELAETIETLAADMMERGQTVGELGDYVAGLENRLEAAENRLGDILGGDTREKPSAGEISASEAIGDLRAKYQHWHKRAQAWEAVADKLAGDLLSFLGNPELESVAEYEALKGGK